MPDSFDSGTIGDWLTANPVWIAVPAVALAWGLLTGRDKVRRKYRRYKARKKRAGK